ncbi:MAG TPA: acetyl-CoA C-acyltransferase [Acidothermaceae bacterium]
MIDAFVLDAVRTPVGRYSGALAGVRPDDLAAHVLKSLMQRAPNLNPAAVDDVVLGSANGAGEENRDVARMAVLLAGLPTSVPGSTVNRLCGSGLEAAIQAARAVETGDASLVVAGGVESMTRAPWVLPKPESIYPRGDERLVSTTLGWRLVNPKMSAQWTITLGESAEILADRYNISRDAQDQFALTSHQRAAQAWRNGEYDAEVVTLEGATLAIDEGIRPDTSIAALARLKPAFRTNGTVTAGNAASLNDGAAALLIGDGAAAARIGVTPMARIASRAVSAVDPDVFGIAPVQAANVALRRAGITWGDLSVVELNEAFAAQSLACIVQWPDLDPAMVNARGGAIAIGHPLGASGARILGAVAHQLRARGGGWGLAAICIGVGQGLAVVLEA